MATQTIYRYILQPYSGPKSRTTCPSCSKPRCFTRYLDTETGLLLPEEYGRCDREANCGYAHNPFTVPVHGGLSYATAIQRGEKLSNSIPPRPVTTALAPSRVVAIPPDIFTASLGHYNRNALAKLLRQHFGLGVANELIKGFQLGTSAYWPGACVFWLIDEKARVRGGQVVLYDETGHTVKQPRRRTTWAHTALTYTSQRQNKPQPEWLTEYEKHGQPCSCLFGLPQLLTAPVNMPVAIVESAKTAILATPYLPEFIWLATMGLGHLKHERLEPVRGRRIVLFPDAGAFDKWQSNAAELRRSGFDVQVSDELENLVTDSEREAGIDLADILLREYPGYPPSWDSDG